MIFRDIILIWCVLLTTATFAQKNSKSQSPLLFDFAIQKYHNSLKYLDYPTAINTLQEVLVLSPEKINFKDSLLAIYFNACHSKSVVLLVQEMEAEGNNNTATFEVLARTFQNAGMLKKDLPYFEKLNLLEEHLYCLYQMATIQFNLSRVQECSENLSKIIQNPKSKSQTMEMSYEKQESQQIPYAAAVFNALGVMALQLKESVQATENFKQALLISPNFLLAKNNLSVLKK
jgi:tetratricopeptide (TPR) repeat protein